MPRDRRRSRRNSRRSFGASRPSSLPRSRQTRAMGFAGFIVATRPYLSGSNTMTNAPATAPSRRAATRPLANHAVEVWLADPDQVSADLSAAHEGLLDAEERRRLVHLRTAKARAEFLTGRVLMRTVLSLYAPAIQPKAWRFAMNDHGRPEIAGNNSQRLFFNMSHTQGLVALAVGRWRDIGIDVERLDRIAEGATISESWFTPAEVSFIAAGDTASFAKRFVAIWTLKEAYCKARGLGLALPLNGFQFDLLGTRPLIAFTERIDDDPSRWRLDLLNTPTGHCLALAMPASIHSVDVFAATLLRGSPQLLNCPPVLTSLRRSPA